MKYLSVKPAAIEHLLQAGINGQSANLFMNTGPIFAVCDADSYFPEEKLVFLAGGTIRWPGTIDVWMNICGDFKSYVNGPRVVRTLLESMIVSLDLHSLLMYVDATNEKAIRFSNWLGFEERGRLEGFGPDRQDYLVMFRRVN